MTAANRLADLVGEVLGALHPWGDGSGWCPSIAVKLEALDIALSAYRSAPPVGIDRCAWVAYGAYQRTHHSVFAEQWREVARAVLREAGVSE